MGEEGEGCGKGGPVVDTSVSVSVEWSWCASREQVAWSSLDE